MNETVKYEIGQEIYYKRPYSSSESPMKTSVTKVGRKWVHLANGYKIAVGTKQCIDNVCGGTIDIYFSADEYQKHKTLQKLWVDFRNSLPYNPSEGVTSVDIWCARGLLKLDKK